jgi:hypothetical protein
MLRLRVSFHSRFFCSTIRILFYSIIIGILYTIHIMRGLGPRKLHVRVIDLCNCLFINRYVRLLLWFTLGPRKLHVRAWFDYSCDLSIAMWSWLFPDLFHDLFPDLCDRCNLYIIVRLLRLVLWPMNHYPVLFFWVGTTMHE